MWTVTGPPSSQARVRVHEHDFAAPSGASSANFTISLTPSASNVSVSGRVLNTQGIGLGRALVTLTDADGNSRMAITNSFGFYRFDDVEAGRLYTAAVTSRKFHFEPRVLNVGNELSDVDFMPVQ